MQASGPVHGPRRVNANNQVSVPVALMGPAGIEKFGEVAFAQSAEDPEVILLFRADKEIERGAVAAKLPDALVKAIGAAEAGDPSASARIAAGMEPWRQSLAALPMPQGLQTAAKIVRDLLADATGLSVAELRALLAADQHQSPAEDPGP